MSERESRNHFKTADLAAHWDIPEDALKRLVRAGEIPFMVLGAKDRSRINWDRVRFKKDVIDQWENEHQMMYKTHVGREEDGEKKSAKELLKGGYR